MCIGLEIRSGPANLSPVEERIISGGRASHDIEEVQRVDETEKINLMSWKDWRSVYVGEKVGIERQV